VGGVYDTCGGQEKCLRGFGGETEVEDAVRKLWCGWEDEFGLGQWQVTGCCSHGDGPSGSIKCGEFQDHRRNW